MVKIRSKYNIEAFKAFQKYSSFKIFILAYICGLSFLGVGIWFAFTSIGSYPLYLLCAVLLPLVLHGYYKFIEFEALKNKLLRNETHQIFSFDENGFELEQISSGANFKDKYFYSEIYSVIKYKRYYFIYINRAQAFIVKNEDYILGDQYQLDELLKSAIKDKFIIKRNSIKIKND